MNISSKLKILLSRCALTDQGKFSLVKRCSGMCFLVMEEVQSSQGQLFGNLRYTKQ